MDNKAYLNTEWFEVRDKNGNLLFRYRFDADQIDTAKVDSIKPVINFKLKN